MQVLTFREDHLKISFLHGTSLVFVIQFIVIADAYLSTAKAINKRLGTNYKAYHVQAITWVAWREMHGIT